MKLGMFVPVWGALGRFQKSHDELLHHFGGWCAQIQKLVELDASDANGFQGLSIKVLGREIGLLKLEFSGRVFNLQYKDRFNGQLHEGVVAVALVPDKPEADLIPIIDLRFIKSGFIELTDAYDEIVSMESSSQTKNLIAEILMRVVKVQI